MNDSDFQIGPPMPHQRDARIGILGAGFIVDSCHLPAYRKAGFNPVAIAGRDASRAADVAKRHGIAKVYGNAAQLLDDPSIEVLDIAVPPNAQVALIRAACARRTVKGILAQKPLGMNYAEAVEAVEACEAAGITLAVNQNMRYDPSVRAAKRLVEHGELGDAVLATIEMRGIPHWMPWQADMGWVTLRILSIHHLDCFRYWFGDPERIFCSVRPDPRTTFPHSDGIATYILEYENGLRCIGLDDTWTGPAKEGCPADQRLTWRIEGLNGLAIGDIGWVKTPFTSPSSIQYAVKGDTGFRKPLLTESWFPDAFAGTMGELLISLETDTRPVVSGRDNLTTMALVEAAYRSAETHRAIALDDVLGPEIRPVETSRIHEPGRMELTAVERGSHERKLRVPAVVEAPRRLRAKTGLTSQLSRKAMQAIEYAGVACDQFGHSAIGTEHLLLGLAEQGSAPVAAVFRQAGITLALLERAVESEVSRGQPFQRIDPPSLKPLVKRVLELATAEAEAAGAPVAGPEHMLLALVRNDEGVGARVLNQLGVSLEIIEKSVSLVPRA